MLAEAAIRFQAKTMYETFPAAGPVKVKVLGEETKEKLEAAQRVKADMNYELTENMVEYRPEHERMLYSLGLAGSAFKKVYYDPNIGRQMALYISAEDVIVPYGASTIEFAERVTHVMRKTKNELKKLQASGFYRELDIGEPKPYHSDIEEKKAEDAGYSLTDDDRYSLYEIHADLVIDGVDDDDEIARPYVVTIERGTGSILSIRRNYEEGDPLTLKRQHFVHYAYVPGFGFYGLGLIHIIGGYAKTGTSLIRQLVDAGTLANLPGGLKSRGLRIKGDDIPIEPGEFKDVDVPSGSIRDNIMPLPYKEPSQTLLALLNQITQEGRRLGAISDINVSDMSANAPVGTTLALLERTLKPMAAVQARVHYAMKQEFKLLKAIMTEYAPKDYAYQPQRGEVSARQADYGMVDVIPVSDPNSSTMAQRVVQYQAVLQMAQQAPQIYDLPQLHRQMIEVLGVKNADKLVPTKDDAKPTDPISENMDALVGKPVKAFIYQDHDAHIVSHIALLGSLVVKSNPQAFANTQAHIMQHISLKAQEEVQKQMAPQMQQMQMAQQGQPMSPQQQQAMQQMMLDMQTRVAQRQAELITEFMEDIDDLSSATQDDPVVKIKEQEPQIKAQETQQDLKEAPAKLSVEKEKMENKEKTDAAKIKQQKDAVALRSAIAIEKLERESQQKVLDKAEKITKNIQDTFNKGI